MSRTTMNATRAVTLAALLSGLVTLASPAPAQNPQAQQQPARGKTSYDQIAPPLLGQETFAAVMAKDKADKAAVMERQKKLLEERGRLHRSQHRRAHHAEKEHATEPEHRGKDVQGHTDPVEDRHAD